MPITLTRVSRNKMKESEGQLWQTIDTIPTLAWSARPDGSAVATSGPQWNFQRTHRLAPSGANPYQLNSKWTGLMQSWAGKVIMHFGFCA